MCLTLMVISRKWKEARPSCEHPWLKGGLPDDLTMCMLFSRIMFCGGTIEST
jgi:hypothetical protein